MKATLQILTLAGSVAMVSTGWTQASTDSTGSSDEYTRTIESRAGKIVASLAISETNRANRVRAIIVQQYRDLSAIHAARDAQFQAAKAKAMIAEPGNKAVADAPWAEAVAAAKPKLERLHGEFLEKISAELPPEQVDKVKDGMTYGVAPLTYGVYLKMYPDLTDEQKAQIKAWLNEARELAMDGSTSDEKHAVFGKYKGRINNYLAKAGYDAKKAEQNLKKAASSASETKAK